MERHLHLFLRIDCQARLNNYNNHYIYSDFYINLGKLKAGFHCNNYSQTDQNNLEIAFRLYDRF